MENKLHKMPMFWFIQVFQIPSYYFLCKNNVITFKIEVDVSGPQPQNAWFQPVIYSVILDKSSNCLHICLSFSNWKMRILLLTYLTVGGSWGPEDFKWTVQSIGDTAWCKVHSFGFFSPLLFFVFCFFFKKCTGSLPFSETGNAWHFKAQSWKVWITIHLKWVYWGIVPSSDKFSLCYSGIYQSNDLIKIQWLPTVWKSVYCHLAKIAKIGGGSISNLQTKKVWHLFFNRVLTSQT